MCEIWTVSFWLSASCAAVIRMVCPVLQLELVKVTVAGSAETSLPASGEIVIGIGAFGWASSTAV